MMMCRSCDQVLQSARCALPIPERTRDELWDECKRLTSALDVATASKGELVHVVDEQSKMVRRLEKQIQQILELHVSSDAVREELAVAQNGLSEEKGHVTELQKRVEGLITDDDVKDRTIVLLGNEKQKIQLDLSQVKVNNDRLQAELAAAQQTIHSLQEERAMRVQSQPTKLSNESCDGRSKELEDELSHLRTEMQRRKAAWRDAKNLIMARQQQLQSTIAHLEGEAREMNKEMAKVVGEQQCLENIAAQRKVLIGWEKFCHLGKQQTSFISIRKFQPMSSMTDLSAFSSFEEK
uniref:Uncharacterized protein n=1 Tax=Eptatretus burgeri TaxID=7764 RepID=A0A8C4Q871_EPTBU